MTSEFEFDLKWTANSMYAASTDTVRTLFWKTELFTYPLLVVQVLTCVSHFLLAMMAHPAVLAKAQKEIDTVVGSDRLPTLEDRPSLPYGLSFTAWGVVSSHSKIDHSRGDHERDLPLGSACAS